MTSYEREQKKMHEQMEKNMLPIFLGVIGAILAGPALFFVARRQFKALENKYFRSDMIRIHEGFNGLIEIQGVWIGSVCVAFGGGLFCLLYSVFGEDGVFFAILAFVLGVLLLLYSYIAAKMIGTYTVGVLFYPSDRLMLMSQVFAINTLSQDFLQFKWIRDSYSLQEIKIDDIEKITRERGTEVYFHGSFGTAHFKFSCKQKRDECIYNAEKLAGRKLSSLDFGV